MHEGIQEKMELREYQKEAIESLWGELFVNRTALCALPTGAGKTFIFQKLIEKSISKKPDIKIVIILNKILLLKQTINRFIEALGESKVGVYCGGEDKYETEKSIIIATIQSIYDLKLDSLNLIIIDEVHGVDQDNGRYIDFLNSHTTAKIVAFSATPFRSDGYIYGENKLFKKITYKKSVIDMINEGFLVRPLMKKVNHQFDVSKLKIKLGEFDKKDVTTLVSDKKKIYDQVEDAFNRISDRKCVIWSCASISHAEDVCEEINKREPAVCLHSKLSAQNQELNTVLFESGKVRHLVFVTIASEGWDHPPVDCVILMRPIRSPVLYVQIVGRGLRNYKDKKDCLVLDYGKVVETLGPIDKPLISEGRIKKSDRPIPMRVCSNCFEYCNYGVDHCPTCEFQFVKKETNPTKNLERKSSFGSLLSSQPVEQTFEVHWTDLGKHKSKNGNECLRIIYTSNDMLASSISEYFVFNNPWAYKRMQQRLIQLECELKPTLDEQSQVKPNRNPSSLVFTVEDGFKKIKRLIFTC